MIDWQPWFGARSVRERRLLVLAAALTVTVTLTTTALTVRDHFRTLTMRIAARRQELAAVRRLAAEVQSTTSATVTSGPWLARIETIATAVVGQERLAALSPTTADDGQTHLTMRISDATLAEVVALLYAIEGHGGSQRVARLELHTRPGTETRFDVVTEVTTLEAPS